MSFPRGRIEALGYPSASERITHLSLLCPRVLPNTSTLAADTQVFGIEVVVAFLMLRILVNAIHRAYLNTLGGLMVSHALGA